MNARLQPSVHYAFALINILGHKKPISIHLTGKLIYRVAWLINITAMVDEEAFNDLLEKKYAQIVLYILLKTENHTMGFTELKNKTNGMAKNPSKGATELGSPRETDFSSRTLDEILSKAEEIGVCKRVVPDDSKEWKLLVDNLSKFQYNLIESKNRPSENHMDTASKDWDNFG